MPRGCFAAVDILIHMNMLKKILPEACLKKQSTNRFSLKDEHLAVWQMIPESSLRILN